MTLLLIRILGFCAIFSATVPTLPSFVFAENDHRAIEEMEASLAASQAPDAGDADKAADVQDLTEPGKVFDAKTVTLENGLQVVVVENRRAPVVTQMVWYRVGAADEPRGTSGIAHFLEHLQFKGSEQVDGPDLQPGEFSKIVKGLGGNDNAFTSQDYTAYYQSIPVEHLERVMKMEAGRMRGTKFPEDEVAAERLVILEERRQRTDNNPQAKFSERLLAALFVNHPYGIPVIGWAHEMAELSWDDATDFYNHHYGPNNAVLVISGDVEAAQVFEMAERIYGPLPRADVPERVRPAAPELVGQTLVRYADPAVRQPMFERVYKAPSYRMAKQESLALQVLEEIAGSDSTSRLYKSLVIEQKLATSAGLSYSSYSWDDAQIWVTAAPAPGVSLPDLEKAVDAELHKLVEEPVSEKELSDALMRLQAEAIYARDSLTGPAMVIGYALATGASLDDVEYWPREIAKVTAAQIQEAAQKYLNPGAADTEFVTGYLEVETPPADEAQEQTEAGDE